MDKLDKIETLLNNFRTRYNSSFNVLERDGNIEIIMDNRELSEDEDFNNKSNKILLKEFGTDALNMFFVYDYLGEIEKEDKVYSKVSDSTQTSNNNSTFIDQYKYNLESKIVTQQKNKNDFFNVDNIGSFAA